MICILNQNIKIFKSTEPSMGEPDSHLLSLSKVDVTYIHILCTDIYVVLSLKIIIVTQNIIVRGEIMNMIKSFSKIIKN